MMFFSLVGTPELNKPTFDLEQNAPTERRVSGFFSAQIPPRTLR